MPTAANESIDFEQSREDMVERQVRTWTVFDENVLEAMRAVPREQFVPAQYRTLAYSDVNIPLGKGEVMMQAKVEGRLLQALSIKPTDRVLEIGTGSGYLATVLARLGGHVHSVDIRPEFTAMAQANLQPLAFKNITLETRDASKLDDLTEDYDCIIVTGAMPVLHASFRRRLTLGGRLAVIIGKEPIMEAQLHTRVAADDWAVESLFDTLIPPLVNAWNPPRFVL